MYLIIYLLLCPLIFSCSFHFKTYKLDYNISFVSTQPTQKEYLQYSNLKTIGVQNLPTIMTRIRCVQIYAILVLGVSSRKYLTIFYMELVWDGAARAKPYRCTIQVCDINFIRFVKLSELPTYFQHHLSAVSESKSLDVLY